MDVVLPAVLFLGVPLLMLFLFKSNSGIMFLSACAGLVLLGSLDPVVVTTAGAIVPGEGEAYVRLAVVMLSIVFAGLVFRGTTSGSSFVINTILAVILAVMLWLSVPAVISVSWLAESVSNNYWRDVNNFRTLIIALGFALSLIVVLLGHKKPHKKSKH